MSDKYKKESTPPPLLLMPAGGGLTLNPPDQPNVLMPVVQTATSTTGRTTTPQLFDSEIEAEADSFVGQSSPAQIQPQTTATTLATNYFQAQHVGTADPFAQVGGQLPHPPQSNSLNPAAPTTFGQGRPSLSSFSPADPPPPGASQQNKNIYRHQGGRPQYVPPPTGMFSQPSQPSGPPTSNLPPFPTPSTQPPTAMVPPMATPPTGQFQPPTSFTPGGSSNLQTVPAGQDRPGQYTGGLYYTPVRNHWCYMENQQGTEVWRPFSYYDSMRLEMTLNSTQGNTVQESVVITSGGRYEVDVGKRVRSSVFWEQPLSPVRRCSWFFKREGDNRYIPYDEEFAGQLEEEYKKAMETAGWHRRLEFPGKEIIVMHNANVIVQFPESSAPDEWGNVQGDQMRPRVVKRGVEDFATIEQGEREEIDHLVFFIPGIEDFSESQTKSVEEYVDNFRSNAHELLKSHFTEPFQAKTINRVEFLPVLWTKALTDETGEVNKLIKSISLPSTSKLRHFLNNVLVDTMFYNSPQFCHKICETIGNEMNRMFHVFLEKHQAFSGDVSLAGHGLGSTILFDLLLHQRLPGDPSPPSTSQSRASSEEPVSEQSFEQSKADSESKSSENEETSLEDLLSKVGLQDKVSLFQEEQIDIESLIMCSEQDLKDIGLPMGPRKKLLGLLKEEQVKKEQRAKSQIEKTLAENQVTRKPQAEAAATADVWAQRNGEDGGEITAAYIKSLHGVGQLKITYPQLDFIPTALFALGSPIAMYLSLRGVQSLGEFFQLPTCPRVYNIFHPFDPMAFRLEPLIRPNMLSVKPVQVPHYKGRKRLHLEFKEAVTRYGTDIKQKIIDSFKSTWNSINEFANFHRSDSKPKSMETEVQSEMDQMMSQITAQQAEDDKASVSSMAEEEIHIGQLNEGQRIDYVLQEGPLESFNDYLFALASHSCYWESEDTALLLLKEIYSPLGIRPKMPGAKGAGSPLDSFPRQAPPPSVAMPPKPPMPPTSFHSGVYNEPPSSTVTFAPPPFHSQTPQCPPGPPPTMYSAQMSSPFQATGGSRKSPYVAPDFNNLPPVTSVENPAMAGPPPMGPAIPGGYRRTMPM